MRLPGKERRQVASEQVVVEVANLETLDATALRTLWPASFGRPAPARMQRRILSLALAHRMQCTSLGGLTREAARSLDDIAAREFGEKRVPGPKRIKIGTKFVREWHGTVHEVEVVDDGFVWHGARYRSLSAIARAITGTRWNGLVFFGLKSAPHPYGGTPGSSDSARGSR